MNRISLSVALFAAFAAPAAAAEFQRISQRDAFVDLVEGRSLTRFAVRLEVVPGGDIVGRAFGRPISGTWTWSDGHFCRELSFDDGDLGMNCQTVALKGQTLRFIADRGTGDRADLTLR